MYAKYSHEQTGVSRPVFGKFDLQTCFLRRKPGNQDLDLLMVCLEPGSSEQSKL